VRTIWELNSGSGDEPQGIYFTKILHLSPSFAMV